MRTYEQTYPWISYRWEPRRVPYPTWLLLGQAATSGHCIAEAPLTPDAALSLHRSHLAQGVHAMAVMEGNTLSLLQVEKHLQGQLVLPNGQLYLSQEIDNLMKAVAWTDDRLQAGDRQLSPWSIQLLNTQVLKSLPWEDDSPPGDYRTVRQAATATGGAPAQDIGFLMERLCEWLGADRFLPEHEEERMAFGLVRAFLAHLYILWIRPFAEGNVRTAWLVGYQLLRETGVPPMVAFQWVEQASIGRAGHFREAAHAAKGVGDPIPFVAHQARQLCEGLGALRKEVHHAQQDVLLDAHLRQLLDPDHSPSGARRMQLLQALRQQPEPVPMNKVILLTPELASTYARLNPKTLLRDVELLREQGLLERSDEGLVPGASLHWVQ